MEFWKMNGAGNDFILVDNRREGLTREELCRLAQKLCHRQFGIGADGLMAVEEAKRGGDYAMAFFNSDGSPSEMCGNGARCICRFGYEMGLAGELQRVETGAGLVTGRRLSRNQYQIRLNDPSVADLDRPATAGLTGYMELGRPGHPHCIFPVPGLETMELSRLRPLGKALRNDPAYPKGANANLYDFLGEDHLVLRTYERGVEDFTLACGTGTGALVALLTLEGKVSGRAVRVENPGGTLLVDAKLEDGHITELLLTGPAAMVCHGETME